MDINDLLENVHLSPSNKLIFPSDVLKWMKANASPRMSLKLMQICKYFQHQKFPYFVIKKIYCDEVLWGYHTLDGTRHETENMDDIPNEIWLTDAITIMYCSKETITKFLAKIVVCDIKILNIHGIGSLDFNEFKFLVESGNVESLNLTSAVIMEKDGKFTYLEEIFELLPKLKNIQIYQCCQPLLPSDDKIIPPPNLEIIDFQEIPEISFNFAKFLIFMSENQHINYFLGFDGWTSIYSYNYFSKDIKKLMESWSPQYQKPNITFPFTPEELHENDV